LIVVYAVRGTAAPGDVQQVEVGQATIPSQGRPHSSHVLALGATVELARALGRLPQRLVLVGIQGADFGHGQRLSPAVSDAVARVGRAVLREVRAAAAVPDA
jgi:hydrogenase maturation protease